MMFIVCREFAANLPQRCAASPRHAGCVGYTAPNPIALSARFDMNSSKPAALFSALSRVRVPLVAAAVAATLAAAPAVAQTQPAKSSGTRVAQEQSPQQPSQGQTFEEEIVPQRYANNAKVDAFIDEMVSRNGFDSASLHALFSRISYSATAVKLVKPAPTPSVKNWSVYRSRFIEPIRINAGVKFWKANQATLQRASREFGVPPEVIVGIIGVETIYGRYMGNFRVLDTLTTLTFDYPDTPNRDSRQATFRKNLEDFLVWTRDNQLDPTTVLGSYTGAIGIPQFLPSSIRQYAVDYDGGHVDLRSSPADAIGSVANYLKQHGWETDRPVVWRITPDTGSLGIAQAAADGQPKPHWALSQLLRAGLTLNEPTVNITTEGGTPVTVVDLPSPGRATEYMLGLKNFYVLTRYNRSFFYALTVYQLGEAVKAQMEANGALPLPAADTETPAQ
ncbi:lytic murein transglycosylase B [Burkholderia ambifaria]|uniref:lytic murein transglycosylase B n=1 Tax=Burkholderia ambifaria TaxID=152480 RepID=UPI001B9270C9|nr:lytic murein transglycosylase B [Burkholderia ambifaria]MBR8224048.1 lytic murein transglycosylase B [Burkholderia ambifaria]